MNKVAEVVDLLKQVANARHDYDPEEMYSEGWYAGQADLAEQLLSRLILIEDGANLSST